MIAAIQPNGSSKVVLKNHRFAPSTLTVPGGKVAFYLTNLEDCPRADCRHDMVIQDSAGNTIAQSDNVFPGEARVFTINTLAPGTYPFSCSVGFHAQFGMTGTLTVS